MLSSYLRKIEDPNFHSRLQAGDQCGSSGSSWWCLGLAFRAEPDIMRPKKLQNPSPGPRGWPLNHSSLLPCSFRTDRYMLSERAPGGWERSKRLLHHSGAQVLIGQINLPGEKRMQPSHRQGSPGIKICWHWDLHQHCPVHPHLSPLSWGSFSKTGS